jgi:hypothetical protein
MVQSSVTGFADGVIDDRQEYFCRGAKVNEILCDRPFRWMRPPSKLVSSEPVAQSGGVAVRRQQFGAQRLSINEHRLPMRYS